MKNEQEAQLRPLVDPNHKHGPPCPVDQWQGVRGFLPDREPTAREQEEQEHQLAVLAGPPLEDTPELLPPPAASEPQNDPARLEKLKTFLQSKQVPTRLEAIESLSFMGPAAAGAAPDLIRILEEDHSGLVREAAAECLGKWKTTAAIPALIDAMERDEYRKVRAEAATALARIGREAVKDALPALKESLKKQKDEETKGTFEAAINRLENLESQYAAVTNLSFDKHVLPILTAKCSKCHDAVQFKSGLDVTSLAALRKGGRSGFPAVVPGDLKKSELWQQIDLKGMPPEGVPDLTAAEIETIKRWIVGKD
jgi:hypothetical protein